MDSAMGKNDKCVGMPGLKEPTEEEQAEIAAKVAERREEESRCTIRVGQLYQLMDTMAKEPEQLEMSMGVLTLSRLRQRIRELLRKED